MYVMYYSSIIPCKKLPYIMEWNRNYTVKPSYNTVVVSYKRLLGSWNGNGNAVKPFYNTVVVSYKRLLGPWNGNGNAVKPFYNTVVVSYERLLASWNGNGNAVKHPVTGWAKYSQVCLLNFSC